jgi:acyl-CoA thioesterase-1
MREPIRTRAKGSGTARAIQYSLTLGFAWLLLLPFAGCSSGEAEKSPDGTTKAETSAPPIEARPVEAGQAARPVIVFLGTSLTAGYGLPESQAFPALIQERIDASELDYRVINAGVSGDTSAGGLRRLGWLLRLPIAALVLELGANDMLRGQSVSELRSNLEAILERTSDAHPEARFLIAGMRAAPNLGRDYAGEFDGVYPALASKYDTAFVPFLLQDVAAQRRLNQADGIHPTAEGHVLIADRVWQELRSILR